MLNPPNLRLVQGVLGGALATAQHHQSHREVFTGDELGGTSLQDIIAAQRFALKIGATLDLSEFAPMRGLAWQDWIAKAG